MTPYEEALVVRAREGDRAAFGSLIEAYQELVFAVALDQQTTKQPRLGETFARYHVERIPHAVLIDPSGNVIVHGEMEQVTERLEQELRAPNK